MVRTACVVAIAAGVAVTGANAQVVFSNFWNNGFFTPFDASTPSSVRYGDSGWLGSGPSVALDRISLVMVAYNPGTSAIAAGTTNLNFTFNDGDPSGLVFGPGSVLRATTLTNVELPEVAAGGFSAFTVDFSLAGVSTTGGFNNIGWSIGVDNFSYGGQLGFAASSAAGQSVGFYTLNASFYNGSSWSLFSFGSDPNTGVANFVAAVYAPSPGGAALLGLAGIAALRRRRG